MEMSPHITEITAEIDRLTSLNAKGVEALFEAEEELAHAENELDTVEARAFLQAEGSVADRTAKAKLASAEVRLQRDLAKAGVNRIRTKLRTIESALMALATKAKLTGVEARL